MAYDLHESGLSNREIYAQIKGLKPGEAEWALVDTRGERGILEDWELPVEDDSDDGELDSATPQEKAVILHTFKATKANCALRPKASCRALRIREINVNFRIPT